MRRQRFHDRRSSHRCSRRRARETSARRARPLASRSFVPAPEHDGSEGRSPGVTGRGRQVAMEGIDQLTPVERECLSLVARGFQSKEIAAATGRASKTVDKHIENACRKLGVGTRRQAARLLEGDLRSVSVEAPFPLSISGEPASAGDRKGGTDAAHLLRSSPDHVGGVGGDLRRPGGEPRAEGGGGAPASDDERAAGGSFTARSYARDLLHRARSSLRERSTATAASPVPASRLRRLLMIPVIAAVAVAVLAAILGGAIQLQLAVQAIDRTLSSR